MDYNNHYIFPGRFQPFHNDHLFVVQEMLDKYPACHLYLAILFNIVDDGCGSDVYEELSVEHFLPARNPFSPQQRLAMITTVVQQYGKGRLFATLMPRPSAGSSWNAITRMFPGKRTWVVPSCGEAWDDQKAVFLQRMGETVKRIEFQQTTDGRRIRSALETGDHQYAQQCIPPAVWSVMKTFL